MTDWFESPWLYLGLGAAVVGVMLIPEETFSIGDYMNRGARLTNTSVNAYGFIDESPEDLRVIASGVFGQSIPLHVYSLARMIRSEGALQGEARGHVALNDLATFPYAHTLHDLVTYSTDSSRKGRYGRQYTAATAGYPKADKRRYSTAIDPYTGDVNLAAKVINDHSSGIDPTGGAVKFLDKKSLSVQPGAKDFAFVDSSWRSEGLVGYNLPQFGTDLVFYRRG